MLKPLAIFLLTALSLPAISQAGARRFTYVYEAIPAAPGTFEIENWITWKTERQGDGRYRQLDFRHEVEFGLTDRLQMAVYVADWSGRGGNSFESEGAVYNNSAVELLYGLTNPATSAIGSAIYGELQVGDRHVALEGKMILQKDVGHWTFAYNASLEGEWKGLGLAERTGEFQQTAGVSYEISPRFLLGAELLHEVEFPDFGRGGDNVVYAGPNVSVRAGNWWATTAALVQLTNTDEPDVQVRTIFGYSF